MKRFKHWAVAGIAIVALAIAGCQTPGTDASVPGLESMGPGSQAMPSVDMESDAAGPSAEASASP